MATWTWRFALVHVEALRQQQRPRLTTESIWLYLAMSLCRVRSMIMATIPDRNRTITSEFMMLEETNVALISSTVETVLIQVLTEVWRLT